MEVVHNSCNICTRVLPDMCTPIPRACGPQEFGCTYQAEHSVCVTTIKHNASLLKSNDSSMAYIDTCYIRLWFSNNSTEKAFQGVT